MPKSAVKKLGNPKLDKKRKVNIPPARNEAEAEENIEFQFYYKLKTLEEYAFLE
mgnify:CR=1 FL=1